MSKWDIITVIGGMLTGGGIVSVYFWWAMRDAYRAK